MMNDLKKNLKSRALRKGTYSVGLIFVVLAVIVVLNMIVRALPATITKQDLSINRLYTLTDTTINYLKALDEDVNIYLIAAEGEEFVDLYNMLEKYAGWSSHITFEQINPKVNPNFVSQYTSEFIETNSVIVESEKRYKIVNYKSFATYVFDFDLVEYVAAFDGEGLITSAIDYVVTDDLPKMYISTGHSEAVYTDTFAAMISKANVVTENLNLLDVSEMPDDCDIFFVYSPSVDFSPAEAQRLIEYLDKGGSMIFISGNTGIDFINLGLVLEYYGLEFQKGIVIETDSKYYLSGNTGLRPARTTHKVSNSLITKGISVYMPESQGIAIRSDARSSMSITKLLMTSDNSYIRTSTSTLLAMQPDDTPGPVMIGAIVEEKVNGKDVKLAVYSSGYLLDESCNTVVSGANYELAVNTITWMCDIGNNISISPKSSVIKMLSTTQNDFYKWTIITVVAVPVCFIGIGFVIWVVRRRK